jgi:hypothetical protein
MAYDASNNQPDQNQVVSSTPLSGGQQPAAQTQPQDSQPNQAPSQPSTVQAGMSSTQAGAAQQPTQQKSASSGMFTNIQKYVQKNKPQAQKMASAVTQNVGSQASEIAQQAKQKEAQMKESLAANTAAMEAQKKEAGQIVGGIMGANYDTTTGQFQAQPAQPQVTPEMQQQPAQQSEQQHIPTLESQQTIVGEMKEADDAYRNKQIVNPYEGKQAGDVIIRPKKDQWGRFVGTEEVTITQEMIDNYGKPLGGTTNQPVLTPEEQQARFQELMQGPTGISQVGNLNIAQQNQRARALQQLAGTANTEMGRRGLLQDTFRQGGKEYTQGMGSLDQLITSGDQQAREALVTGVQEQATGLQDQLQQVSSEANKAKMAQDMAMKNFGTDVTNMATQALESDQFSNLDQNYETLKNLEDQYAKNQLMDLDYDKLISDSQSGFDTAKGAFKDRMRAELNMTTYLQGSHLRDQATKEIAAATTPEALRAIQDKYSKYFRGNSGSWASDRTHQLNLAKSAYDKMIEKQQQQKDYLASKGLLSDKISGLLPETQQNLQKFQGIKSLLGKEDIRSLEDLSELDLDPRLDSTRTGDGSGGRYS